MNKTKIHSLKTSGFLAIAAFLMMIFSVSELSAQTVHTFTNSSSIEIEDFAVSDPYPSTISVSGIPTGSVTRVIVKIKGLTHSYPEDIGLILVSPTGQKVRIFTDCMGDGGGDGVSGIDLTFDDEALIALPDNPSGDTPSGIYKPKRGTSDGFSPEHGESMPSPAPSGPYADTLAGFNGTASPLGVWSLYSDDNAKGDDGIIANGWELTIYSLAPTAATATVSGQVKNATGTGINGAVVTLLDLSGNPRATYTNMFGYYTFLQVMTGESHTLSVSSKGHTFNPSSQIINLSGDETFNWQAQ